MKKIPFFLLLLLLGISGYILSQRKENRTLVFENNLKCAQYVQQQTAEVHEIGQLPINQGKTVTSPKIFFSEKLNTCLSAYSIRDFRENGFSSFYIYNLLNNDEIFSDGGGSDETINGVSIAKIAEQKYRDKLKELGGE